MLLHSLGWMLCCLTWRWWIQQFRLLYLRPGANHKTEVSVGHGNSVRSELYTSWLLVLLFQVSVRNVSRRLEGRGTAPTSTSPPPVSFSLLVPRHEPHLRRHIYSRTATIFCNSLPTGRPPTAAAHTGLIAPAATSHTCDHVQETLPTPPFFLCRHRYPLLGIAQRRMVQQQQEELCSAPPPLSRSLSNPTLQTLVSFRPLLPLNSHPACQKLISTVSQDR